MKISLLFFGILSFIQITFLPGILILKAFKIKPGFIQTLVFSFALSLISNHLIVFAITTLGFNISYTYYIIFIIELLLVFKLYTNFFKSSLGDIFSARSTQISSYITSTFSTKPASPKTFAQIITTIITIIFMIFAASSIWWAFKLWINNFDTVFTLWDAIVSWNHWAVEWFSGSFPNQTRRYAQLIPTNFAVSYAFLGNTQIQIFAKGFMPLFNLYILLLMFDLGLETKQGGYFIGVVVTRFVIKKFLGVYISSGYVDVALAFFSFVSIYALLKAKTTTSQKQQVNYIWIGAIFSAGAALTKQNGLFIFGIYPVLAYLLVAKTLDNTDLKKQLSYVIKPFLFGLLLILPWYLYNEYRIFTGTNETNVLYLIGERHEGRALVERFVRAAGMLEEYVFLYIFILILLPFLDITFKWITVAILLPYSLIWALGFSTFARNLAIAMPFLGLITGLCAQKSLVFGERLIAWLKVSRIKILFVLILIFIAIYAGGQFLTDARLINHQNEQQKEILQSSVNHRIYAYFEEIGGYEPIMTNYPIRHLPGLENMQVPVGNFADYDFYQWTKNQNPEVRLMLIFRGRVADDVQEEITKNLELGTYELIFKEGAYSFIRMNKEVQ